MFGLACALAGALTCAPPAAHAAARTVTPPGVHYGIDVRLDTHRQQLDGWETIGYRSGADTTLDALWLHAYPNAFSSEKTVYGREEERFGEDYELRFAPPRDRGWMTLDSVSVGGVAARVIVEETLARIELPRPLAPGDSTTVRVHFRVGIPRVFDRFGHTGTRYSIAQWYPKMVVYDKRGWARDPYHLFAEFYGEFATYDVAITLPDEQWVGATGVLASAEGGDNDVPLEFPSRDSVTVRVRAVTADSLAGRWPRESLRLEALGGATIRVPRDSAAVWRVPAGAPLHYRYVWAESAGVAAAMERDEDRRPGPLRRLIARADTSITDTLRALAPPYPVRAASAGRDGRSSPADSTIVTSLKTLRFHAEGVHDFAFVTAPDYVRADTTWNGIAIRTLIYHDDVAPWRNALAMTVRSFQHHSAMVGPYIWPQFTTAESYTAGGAMEYPMLIMNDPDLSDSQWEFLGPTISHEAGHNWFYGMIANDERRHPWLDEGLTQFLEDDESEATQPHGGWKHRDRFRWVTPARDYLHDEAEMLARHYAHDEVPPSFAADDCRGYPQYGTMAYGRPAMMLRTLQSIEGRERMRAFLGELYRRRVGRHVEPEDVVDAARATLGPDYSDYFRRWIETTEVPDFALGGMRRERAADGWRATVTVKRKGEIAFPVPVEARYADGTTETKLVPTPAARNEVVFENRSPLVKAVLDPRHEIFDANRLDNQGTLLPPLRLKPLFDISNSEAISLLYGPTVWHGSAEGMRLGGWMEGRYLPGPDFPQGIRSLEGGLNVGTRDGSVAWRAGYGRRVEALGARGSVHALAARDAGLTRAELTLSNRITEPGRRHPFRTWTLRGQYLDRDRHDSFDGPDRVDPAYWSAGRTLNVGGSLRLETKAPRRAETITLDAWHGFDTERHGGGDRASYDRASLEARQTLALGPRREVRVENRLYGGLSWRDVPRERLFDGVEATRLETLDRFYANDLGPLRESDHYWTEGGGGLRGYVGRVVLGRRIAGGSIEASHRRWPLTLFVDAERLQADPPFDRTLADAGFGLHVSYFRIDAPLWVSRPEPGENPFDARWVVSFDLPDPRFR